ncbi:hypothetical protein KL928_001466 [Ogataea angusta]|uniref:Uncharacterized protein n=2 Tax=Pichia angusta TaxID=870730 RepID=A0AAN6I7J1_PICAN|nr:uncharacterized protein KL928_001466 [Ogataea angusta]KAG7820029.1 hypothetical protein KL928_001466 [Ogataea angusta]
MHNEHGSRVEIMWLLCGCAVCCIMLKYGTGESETTAGRSTAPRTMSATAPPRRARSIATGRIPHLRIRLPTLVNNVRLLSIAMYRAALRTVRTVRPANTVTIQQRYRGGVVDSTKEVLKDINLKVGKTLASGLDKAEDVAETVKEEVSTVKDKAADKKDDLSQKASEKAAQTKQDVSQEAAEMKDSLHSNKENVKREVKENFKGYDSLQDKGSNIEREQQRPDDGV